MAWFPRALAELLVPWLGFLVTGRDHRAMAWFPRALAELLVPWLGFLVPWPSYSCLGLVSLCRGLVSSHVGCFYRATTWFSRTMA
jgi:hypothetical protein